MGNSTDSTLPQDARARDRPDWYDVFLEALSLSGTVTAAARRAGVQRTTPYLARKNDNDFAREWDEALEESIDTVQLTAMRLATDGTDPAMTRWVLKCRRPSLWGDRSKVELSGHVSFDPDADDELFKRLHHLAAVKQDQLDAEAEDDDEDA